MATFFSVHYYLTVGEKIKEFVKISEPFSQFIAFVFLATVVMVVFAIVKEALLTLLKIETLSFINKYGGIFIAGLKGYFICCLVFLSLIISSNEFARHNARRSVSSSFMAHTSVSVYSNCFERIVLNIFPEEKINKKVFRVFSRKKM